jgi:hypothetical protein
MIVFPHAEMVGFQGDCAFVHAAARPDGKIVKFWPRVDEAEALSTQYKTDAHCVSYHLAGSDGAPLPEAPRVNMASLPYLAAAGMAVQFTCIFVDLDDKIGKETRPDRSARPEWREGFEAALRRLPEWLSACIGRYDTRGGARLFGIFDRPVDLATYERLRTGIYAYCTDAGMDVDRLIDWTRLMRLPNVLREGKRQSYQIDPASLSMRMPADVVARLAARGEAIAAAAPVATQRPKSAAAPPSDSSDLRPGDKVNQLPWHEVLAPFGWQFMRMMGDQEAWCRPGKTLNAGDPPSALSNYAGTDTLHVFTTSTELEPGRSYDKFGVFTVLSGLQPSDAARLAVERFGFERPAPTSREPDEADIALKSWAEAHKAKGNAVTAVAEQTVATESAKRTGKRPVQIVQGELRDSVAPTLEALATIPALYQRSQALVELGRDESGRMAASSVQLGRLRLLCEDVCRYYVLVKGASKTLEPDGKASSDWVEKTVKVDDRLVQAILAGSMEWGAILPLSGVVRVPVLHPDGSVCLSGYDRETRLFVDAAGFGEPGTTEAEARAALELLEDVLVDFPFGGAVDKAVIVAMWLTACVRQTMTTAPAFLVDSPSTGIGKTPLVNVAALIATGEMAPMTKAPALEDELAKLLFSLCRDQVPLIAFDDVKGSFGGDVFDQLITSEAVTNRVLGVSRVERAPAKALVMITGRNVTFRGDGVYRTLRARLVTEAERPDEKRAGWKHPDLMGYVGRRRVDLATACLTILRAYILAERPCKMPPHKEFQAWNVVREALIWLGRPDVVDSVELQRDESDVDYSLYVALCRAWHDAVGDAPITLSGLFDLMGSAGSSGFARPELANLHRKALEGAVLDLIEMARTDARAPRVLSRRLRNNIGRPAGGYLLRRAAKDKDAGAFHWQVVLTARTRATEAAAAVKADGPSFFGLELPLSPKKPVLQ